MDGFKPTGLVRPCHRSTKGADVSTLELRRQFNSSIGNPALSLQRMIALALWGVAQLARKWRRGSNANREMSVCEPTREGNRTMGQALTVTAKSATMRAID
jgi:hypothetical protein